MGTHNSKSVIQLYAPNFEVHSRDETHGLFYLKERGSHRQFLFKQIPPSDAKITLGIRRQLERKKSLMHDNLVILRGTSRANQTFSSKGPIVCRREAFPVVVPSTNSLLTVWRTTGGHAAVPTNA